MYSHREAPIGSAEIVKLSIPIISGPIGPLLVTAPFPAPVTVTAVAAAPSPAPVAPSKDVSSDPAPDPASLLLATLPRADPEEKAYAGTGTRPVGGLTYGASRSLS